MAGSCRSGRHDDDVPESQPGFFRDAGDVEAHDAWLVTIDENTAAYYSADVNGDGSIDGSDAGDIEAHDAWLVTLPSQAEMASAFSGAW